jgi:hypothetical protein
MDNEDEPAGSALARLRLTHETRYKFESLRGLSLQTYYAPFPVQAQGTFNGQHFYFRSRGSYWRFELGGYEDFSKPPTWWHVEDWPSDDGLGAGDLSDEEAALCILEAIDIYLTKDRAQFERGHPDFEKTMLTGWSDGALTLQHLLEILGVGADDVVQKMLTAGIRLPFTAGLELSKAKGLPHPRVRPNNRPVDSGRRKDVS